jgi:hypothetical protein
MHLFFSGQVYGCGSGTNIGNPNDKDTPVAELVEGIDMVVYELIDIFTPLAKGLLVVMS